MTEMEQQLLVKNEDCQTKLAEDSPISQDEFFKLLLNGEDFSWQTMIYELIRTEKMDPWDVDVSLLSKKFMTIIKKLKNMDFRITGKMVLAAAILLKIKSNKLMTEDLASFDELIHSTNGDDEYLDIDGDCGEELIKIDYKAMRDQLPTLIPRVPQPRKRKVSIFDIVKALEQALDVQSRRTLRQMTLIEKERELPRVEHKEITALIKDVYDQLMSICAKKRTKILFEELLADGSKDSKIYTFIPVLHLTNQRKIDLNQETHFGPIEIEILKDNFLVKPQI